MVEKMGWRWVVGVAGLWLVCVACSSESNSTPGCGKDADCAAGRICSSGQCVDRSGSGGSGGSSQNPLVGAWFGSGDGGDFCIVVCENGRLFTGDRSCSDTTAGDFSSYLSYTAAGNTLNLSASPNCSVGATCVQSPQVWTVNGTSAIVQWCGLSLTLNRIGDSPLCDDPARTPC